GPASAKARHGERHPQGLTPHLLTAHVCCAMSAVLTRLLTLCLALAFLVGVTAQLVPSSMAQAQMTLSTEMADGCAGPQPPCSGHTPNCVDHVGCITVSALPTSPTSIAVPVEWTAR